MIRYNTRKKAFGYMRRRDTLCNPRALGLAAARTCIRYHRLSLESIPGDRDVGEVNAMMHAMYMIPPHAREIKLVGLG